MAKTRAKSVPRRKIAAAATKRTKVRARASARTKPAVRARPRAQHRFTVSHPNEADFKSGLRSYANYRDLGISAATNGMAQAHVIRFVPPCRPEEVSKLHYHDVDFQLVYVLKGWIKSKFEGEGEIVMRTGSCWIQPPRIKHAVLDYSDDCEVLEIILPAEFPTVTLE
jgi:mannose-6-phosphate isomerase-like protein (cupin superfamily)